MTIFNLTLFKSTSTLKILPSESWRKRKILLLNLGEIKVATPADLSVPKDQGHLPFQVRSRRDALYLQEMCVSCKRKIS